MVYGLSATLKLGFPQPLKGSQTWSTRLQVKNYR